VNRANTFEMRDSHPTASPDRTPTTAHAAHSWSGDCRQMPWPTQLTNNPPPAMAKAAIARGISTSTSRHAVLPWSSCAGRVVPIRGPGRRSKRACATC